MLNPLMEQVWQLSWQAAAVAILVLILRAIFGRALTARWRHAMWLLVLGRLIIPVLPESRFSMFSVFERLNRETSAPLVTALPELNPVHTTVTVKYGPAEKPASTPVRISERKKSFWNISTSLETVWAAGMFIILLRLIVINARFASRLRRDSQLASAGLVSLLDDCRKEMRMARSPGLIITDVVNSPAVIGILRSRILLPIHSIEAASESQIRLVFLHELAHIKCRDVAMDWVWAIVQSLHWFNPILWMIAPLRRGDREQARDEMVLHITGPHQAKLYGQTLLNLSESSKPPIFSAGLVGILSGKRRLRRRIELIASFTGNSNKATLIGAVLLTIAGCAMLTNPTSKKSDGSDPLSVTSTATSSIHGTPETRHYDVNDLLFVAPDYNLRSAINTSELKMSNDQLWASRLQDLKTYIQDNVASNTWKEHGGNIGTIAYVPGGRELVIQQTPENHSDIETALNNLRRGRGVQVSLSTRIIMIDEDDFQKLSPAIKQRFAALSGAGKYRTDQFLNDDELKQIVTSLSAMPSISRLTAPRLTLFNGQNSVLIVSTQQQYVDSLAKETKKQAGHSVTSYTPHTASATATGLEFQCSACASADHNATFVASHLTLTRMIGLLTEHWPDAPANVEANVQRPIMVDYDRSITCAIPKQMTLLLAGFTQTINDARNPLLEKQAVGPALDKIKAADLSVEKERRMRVYLLLTPTILSTK